MSPLTTGRMPNDPIESADINGIAQRVNEIEIDLDALEAAFAEHDTDANRFVYYLPEPTGSAAGDVALLEAANTAAAAQGGGKIIVGPAPASAPYQVNQNLDEFAQGVSLEGAGVLVTVFRLTHADAKLSWADGWRGGGKDFSVHGGTLATQTAINGIKVNVINQGIFENIEVRYLAENGFGVQLDGTQNSLFKNVAVYTVDGHGIGITNSAGTNLFVNCGVRAFKGYAWWIGNLEAGDPNGIGTDTPLCNTIIGGVYEGMSEAPGGDALGWVYINCSDTTHFWRCVFAMENDAVARNGFVIEPEAGRTACNLELTDVVMSGSATGTLIDLRGQATIGCWLFISGRFSPAGALHLFKLTDYDRVDFNCDFVEAAITNFATKSSGVIPYGSLILNRSFNKTGHYGFVPGTTTGAFTAVDDAATEQVRICPNHITLGVLIDTGLYRFAAGFWAIQNALNFPVAVAAGTVPNNTIFLDSADNVLKKKDNAGAVSAI